MKGRTGHTFVFLCINASMPRYSQGDTDQSHYICLWKQNKQSEQKYHMTYSSPPEQQHNLEQLGDGKQALPESYIS